MGNPAWVKGVSGNPGGRPKEKPFTDALRRVLKQEKPEALRDLARKLIDWALEGEQWAAEMLVERLDGKAPQQIQVGREDARDMSVDDILSELAEARAAAGIAGEEAGAGESGQVH